MGRRPPCRPRSPSKGGAGASAQAPPASAFLSKGRALGARLDLGAWMEKHHPLRRSALPRPSPPGTAGSTKRQGASWKRAVSTMERLPGQNEGRRGKLLPLRSSFCLSPCLKALRGRVGLRGAAQRPPRPCPMPPWPPIWPPPIWPGLFSDPSLVVTSPPSFV